MRILKTLIIVGYAKTLCSGSVNCISLQFSLILSDVTEIVCFVVLSVINLYRQRLSDYKIDSAFGNQVYRFSD